MGLITLPTTEIRLAVSDKIIDDTIIKQEVVFTRLEHSDHNDHPTAIIHIKVESFSSKNGLKGESLNEKGMPDKYDFLLASNRTAVNATTGAIVLIRTDETDEDWFLSLSMFSQDIALQGNFFRYLRDNAPIVIGDLIKQHIMQADAMGKFA